MTIKIFNIQYSQEHIPYFESKHLGVINASPTAMGLLTNRGPPVWHPAPLSLKVNIWKLLRQTFATKHFLIFRNFVLKLELIALNRECELCR